MKDARLGIVPTCQPISTSELGHHIRSTGSFGVPSALSKREAIGQDGFQITQAVPAYHAFDPLSNPTLALARLMSAHGSACRREQSTRGPFGHGERYSPPLAASKCFCNLRPIPNASRETRPCRSSVFRRSTLRLDFTTSGRSRSADLVNCLDDEISIFGSI